MAGLKKYNQALRAGAVGTTPPVGAITPDEMDTYVVYNVINPSISAVWLGTRKSGTADVKALTVTNAILDYPRNLEFSIAGSSVGMAGTIAITGRDQFGAVATESLGFGSADNGGTVVGTQIFAHLTAATISFGTFAGANRTGQLGVGTTGTTCLFGLPVRIGGTTDVKLLTRCTAAGAQTVNGGTIAAFVNTTQHAIAAPATLTGTWSLHAWVKPTYNPEAIAINADLPQRT